VPGPLSTPSEPDETTQLTAAPANPGPSRDPDVDWYAEALESTHYYDDRIPADPGALEADDWEDPELAGPPDNWAKQEPDAPDIFAAGFTHRDGAAGRAAVGFAAGGQLDLMEPCLALASFAERAACDGLGALSDDELVGYLSAARRLQSWHVSAELRAVAELDARRQSAARRPGLSRAGDHVSEEIAAALTLTGRSADRLLDVARGLRRLPMVLRALGTGVLDRAKAEVFADELSALSDVAAAAVAAAFWTPARDMTTGQLRRALRLMVASIDPDAVRRRAERGRAEARVECWQETSGNGALAGRELAAADMIAADQRIDSIARALKAAGAAASLEHLRATVFTALLLGRDPADGVLRTHGQTSVAGLTGSVHLTLPAATWLGFSDAAGEMAGFGPVSSMTGRDLAARLARGKASWCVTLTDPDGQAVAHACAANGPPVKSPPTGQQPSHAPPAHGPPAQEPPPQEPLPPDVTGTQARWLAALQFRWLERDECQHDQRTSAYRPGPVLRHLIQIRHQTCAAPGCRYPARRCDLDHTIPYDGGGMTCQCNLAPLCRKHHQAKQASGWQVTQPEPGVLTWTAPHGRSYRVTPGSYPA
jgi:hypothetical protein